jgi:DNA-binding IclR family transcriptional regulator
MPGSASSAVDKALDLLEAIADSDRPQRLSELAARVGLHRATAHRILVDLVARGWVLRAGDHYLPGPAQLRLSDAAARNSLAMRSYAGPSFTLNKPLRAACVMPQPYG